MRCRIQLNHLALVLTMTLPTCAMSSSDNPSVPVRIFQPSADVSSPTLLPLSINFDPSQQCKGNLKSKVLLGAIIDNEGRPRNLRFLYAKDLSAVSGNPDLDKLALLVADHDHFQAASHAGNPVAVAQAIELQITACILTEGKGKAAQAKTIHLNGEPRQTLLPYPAPPRGVLFGASPTENDNPTHGPWRLYKAGKDATEPKLLRYAEAHFSEEARSKKVEGTVILSLIVDSNGLPREIKVTHGLGVGLDENAVAAVQQYRFAPGLHNNQPVAVPINIVVRFRLH